MKHISKIKLLIKNSTLYKFLRGTIHKTVIYIKKRRRVSGVYSYTIVSAVYNVEKYLDEYFSSLVAQTLSFKKHINIIIVDDGSTDNSAHVVKKWQKKYPNNIIYIKKENCGQASARNLGMEYVKSEWITFIDPDDFVQYNYFEVIDNFLIKNKSKKFAFVATNLLFYYERIKRIKNKHPLKYKFKVKESVFPVFDLRDYIQLSASTAVFNASLLNEHKSRFDRRIKPTFEDGSFVNNYLLKTMQLDKNYFVAFIKDAKYYYRKRSDESSTLDGAWGKEERYNEQLNYGYLALLKNFHSSIGFVPRYIQRTVLYDIVWYFKRLINHNEKISFLSVNQTVLFENLLKEIFKYIDIETISTFNLAGYKYLHKTILSEKYKNTKLDKIIYIDNYDVTKAQIELHYFCIDDCNVTFIQGGIQLAPSYEQTKEYFFLDDIVMLEKIVFLPIKSNKIKLHTFVQNKSSQIYFKNKYYKNGIDVIDIEKEFNDTLYSYHIIEKISSFSDHLKIEAHVSCKKFDRLNYFWSSISGKLSHKEISRDEYSVQYEVKLQKNINIEQNDTELFYVFSKSGKEERVWKPGDSLVKDNLPKGYYFTNRYLNLVFSQGMPERYTLFTPVLRKISYTETLMKIEGYLFLPLDEDYQLDKFKIKIYKFREEDIAIDFPLVLVSPECIKIFNHFLYQKFYMFNNLKVFLFEIAIPLRLISNYAGIFNIGIEYNNKIRLIQNYHKSLGKIEHMTTYRLNAENLSLFNLYYDDTMIVWRFEIYNMSKNDFIKLNSLKGNTVRDNNIWLIGEYTISARDNGMHFYHYLLENHPEVDAYYVIDKASKDMPYLNDKKVLYYGSYKHFQVAAKAKVLIFTHMERYLIPKINHITKYKNNYNPYLKVCLQHGVIATTASVDFFHKKLRAYDIFNVSSEFEKGIVKKYLGYNDSEIIINGLPRWDRLYREKVASNTILIIPTWRDGLDKVSNYVFMESQYFKFWNSLLSDEIFISYIEKNNIKVHFFMHIILSGFIDNFSSPSKNILFKNTDNIQDLLLECGLLVTDYSSVAFDALFQNKPVVYAPFDYKEMISKRGEKQLIDYHKDLPGPICFTTHDTIGSIISTIENGWVINEKYRDRRLKFFKYIDGNNSNRVYKSILLKQIGK